jgi:hypothetical protein
MSMNRKQLVSSMVDALLTKYRAEPQRFRSYLPDIAQMLDALQPERKAVTTVFALTERERARRIESLQEAMKRLDTKKLGKEEAIVALEDYAVLLEDNRVPEDLDFDKKMKFFKVLLGKGPSFYKSQIIVPVRENNEQLEVVKSTPLVRGVRLNLTWDAKLVSVSIAPERYRERKKFLAFVGLGTDSASDVAERHDYYLSEIGPHGTS